jgi:hypothetical protein
MSASQILLAGHGHEDQWLSDNPNRTYFEAKYQPRVNRSRETYEIPFDNQVTFDSTGRCTIPVKGDYMTRMTLRTVMPPIYPTAPGQYVYPTPSSEVGATVYVNKTLDLVVADGVTLTANTAGNHYFSIGAQVTLAGTAYVIFDLDGTYTITGIPTANSFTCSTTLAGISYNGTASSPGIECGDIVSYFSTANSNLWVNNLTNKTWQITAGSNVGNVWTFTTSAPSNFPVGSQVVLNLPGTPGILNLIVDVISSTDATFTTSTIRGRFIANDTSTGVQAYSDDKGVTWSIGDSTGWNYTFQPPYITYGNGVYVRVGTNTQEYSIDGVTWTPVASPLNGYWISAAFGNGIFVMIDAFTVAISFDGLSWTPNNILSVQMNQVIFGNGVFVTANPAPYCSYYSFDGFTWTLTNTAEGSLYNIAYGDSTFVGFGGYGDIQLYSNDNGVNWNFAQNSVNGSFFELTFAEYAYFNSPSDSVSLVVPPLQLMDRVFSSDVYPSISFANAADAAFWGFDSREGLTYALPATPPWTLTQSGWISGFLPPSTSTYDDSVAHKLCKAARILVGKQTIKEYSGEYIELQNDLLVPYENKAILKLMNGTLDQTQATVSREYYVNLPLGTKEVPLCALTHQHMSVEVDFDSYLNVSQNLNQGTGDFLDAKSYTTYDASTGLLNGQPVNVQTTFSYQQYIFIVTYGGQFIIFDTTKNVDDPASYIVLSAFSGSSLFSQFCVLSGNLYIGLTDGQLVRGLIDELIQGNISSLELNSYTPTIGALTGTIVADFRYVYYTVSNTVTSNVFMTKYDTSGSFTNPISYTAVDFTKTFNSGVTGVYQTLSTGTDLIMLPMGTPDELYIYQLNANVQSQWYSINYASYGYPGRQITEGVLIGNSLYFVCDNFDILKYENSTFTDLSKWSLQSIWQAVGYNNSMTVFSYSQTYSVDNGVTWRLSTRSIPELGGGTFNNIVYGNGVFIALSGNGFIGYSTNKGFAWSVSITQVYNSVAYGNGVFVLEDSKYSTDNGVTWTLAIIPAVGYFTSVAYGNGVFVMVGFNVQAYSTDNGLTWNNIISLSGTWNSVTFGNGVFVMVGESQAYSTDNGLTWTYVASPLVATYYLPWLSVAYGNGGFVMVKLQDIAYSTDNGLTWNYVASPVPNPHPTIFTGPFVNFYRVAYGDGVFIAVGSDNIAYSTDNGITWTGVYVVPIDSYTMYWLGVALGKKDVTIPGDGFRNLIAVGNYIYCSTNNVAVRIDTTQDLSTAAAYEFPAPLPTNQYVFANGPRYVYMFAQGDNTATNIVEFDPYGPDTTFKASILVDYESLPPEFPKPDKALLGLIQTQKVTDMTQMNIKGPVKELWVTGASATTNVFQYSNLATRSTLELAGEQIVTDDDGTHTFLNVIEPFETHTSMPIRNFSVVSFEFDPESEIPNGTVNFSRIRDQIFDGDAETVWARTYNLFAIQGGIGNLMYN